MARRTRGRGVQRQGKPDLQFTASDTDAVALLFGELLARRLPTALAERQREELPWLRPGAFQAAPGVGYELAPLSAPEINVLGMRGAPATARKPEGGLRVLVLGDSIAFGVGSVARKSRRCPEGSS